MSRVVMALSGGLDSCVLLATFLNEGSEVLCINFSYGSKHNAYERHSAVAIAHHYNQSLIPINLHQQFEHFRSDLLKSGGAIPEGHYEDASMSRTVVPGRNLIFASFLAGIAESNGYDYIALGVHQGDHHIYPDCRPDFVDAVGHAVARSSDGKVGVLAPLINMAKDGIVSQGRAFDAPFHLTRTCYKDQPIACGKCGSCIERLEAFQLNGIPDPIEYEERNDAY